MTDNRFKTYLYQRPNVYAVKDISTGKNVAMFCYGENETWHWWDMRFFGKNEDWKRFGNEADMWTAIKNRIDNKEGRIESCDA